MTAVIESTLPLPVAETGVARSEDARACSPEAQPSDEQLARLAQGGSIQAFGELVERWEQRLTGFLVRRSASRHDIEDLAQSTFLNAWQSLGSFDASRRFGVWLLGIGARVAAAKRRSDRRWARGARTERAPSFVEAHRADRPVVERGEAWIAADRVLAPEALSALWLRYVAEMEIDDIASVLGRSGVAVRVMLFRARQRVARELSRPDDTIDVLRERLP